MSDTEESRPLTRRELRLRAMTEAGSEAPETVASQDNEVSLDTAAIDDLLVGIEISIVDEQGNLRSRREIRELRERAAAELLAARQETAAVFTTTEGIDVADEVDIADEVTVDDDDEEVSQEDLQTAEKPESGSEDPSERDIVEDFDSLPPTVAMDVLAEDLVEADDAASALEDLFAQEDSFEEPASQTHDEELREIAEGADASAEETLRGDAFSEDLTEAENEITSEVAHEGDTGGSVAEPTPTNGYSFPDIAPLDEGQSVFDDPTLRLLGRGSASANSDDARGDFDELINRAVAQEGGASNTSALILPNMPDTENLSGALGDTGELFVTGSIEMPKSLSETGGHSSLHDSVEIEPLDELGLGEVSPADNLMAPVSAVKAVSARSAQGSLLAESAKDKSKMPVVLIATGGVLVVGAVALIIWAASSGLFG